MVQMCVKTDRQSSDHAISLYSYEHDSTVLVRFRKPQYQYVGFLRTTVANRQSLRVCPAGYAQATVCAPPRLPAICNTLQYSTGRPGTDVRYSCRYCTRTVRLTNAVVMMCQRVRILVRTLRY